jgi:hypothetical protein
MKSHGKFDVGTPSTRDIFLPLCVTNIIEVVNVGASNINDSNNTRGHK